MIKTNSLETDFKNYLANQDGCVDIDKLPDSKFPYQKADFYLAYKNSIIEIKTINTDRASALKPWLEKRVNSTTEFKKGMPAIFGTISFKGIHQAHANKDLFNKQLDSLAARTLEGYIREAKRQLFDTRKAIGNQNAFGFLVILNESYDFYETEFVYRIIQSMLQHIKENEPELKIDGVWYINESNASKHTIDVVFIHDTDVPIEVLSNEILDELAQGWAAYRGYISG